MKHLFSKSTAKALISRRLSDKKQKKAPAARIIPQKPKGGPMAAQKKPEKQKNYARREDDTGCSGSEEEPPPSLDFLLEGTDPPAQEGLDYQNVPEQEDDSQDNSQNYMFRPYLHDKYWLDDEQDTVQEDDWKYRIATAPENATDPNEYEKRRRQATGHIIYKIEEEVRVIVEDL